jgi:hypothetical protein
MNNADSLDHDVAAKADAADGAARRITPQRLRGIADLLVKNCSAYQEVTIGVYEPCKQCRKAANELRDEADGRGIHTVRSTKRQGVLAL